MNDLAAWLLEQLTEDERMATEAGGGHDRWSALEVSPTRVRWEIVRIGGGTVVLPAHADAGHIANWDPSRVLAECDAKRRILELHTPQRCDQENCELTMHCALCDAEHGNPWPCATLCLLALPYADAPGYREEWRP